MGTKCLRHTYMCTHNFKCNEFKYFDTTDGTLEILSTTSQSMRVRCSDRALIKRCLNAKPVKGCDTEFIVPNCLFNMFVLGLTDATEHKAQLDEETAKPLYDHQIKDLSTKVDNPFMLNANKMGYGKTVTALAYARHHKCKKILIVCPKSVLYHWKDTIKWYWPEMLDITTILPDRIKEVPQVAIINYDKLIAGNRIDTYKNFAWDCMIMDEGHRIKNRKSKRAIAMKTIPCNLRVALTGTPILRYPDDLFSLCEWLNPKLFGKGYWPFVEKFCRIEETFFGKKIAGAAPDEQSVTDLNNFLRTFMVRNDEIQIGKGIRHNVVKFELSPQVKRLYQLVQKQAIEELEGIMSLPNAMAKTIRLRQLVSNPGVFEEELMKHHIKFQWIKDLIEDNPDTKVVVFSCFSSTIQALQQFLGSNICNTYIGSLSDKVRESNKLAFLNDPRVRVLAGTIGAMGEGVDGLHKVSNVEIFIDRDWSPEINKQAESRLQRDGQQYVVDAYLLEYENTIEQHVGNVNLSKAEDVRRILNA